MGNGSREMALPKSVPFYLYRYLGKCPKVMGMHSKEDYVKWDDEDHKNKDRCKNDHPDAECKGNMKVYYCYYY